MTGGRPVDRAGWRKDSNIDLVRVELAQVTAAYFAGAPIYDRMRILEDKLFDIMRPTNGRPARR